MKLTDLLAEMFMGSYGLVWHLLSVVALIICAFGACVRILGGRPNMVLSVACRWIVRRWREANSDGLVPLRSPGWWIAITWGLLSALFFAFYLVYLCVALASAVPNSLPFIAMSLGCLAFGGLFCHSGRLLYRASRVRQEVD